ncbi:MAG: hypothetical protein J7L34_02185 [Thermotogaceae bacterium]|nr:hypothetical protein [Thermotogaceae bacterium]
MIKAMGRYGRYKKRRKKKISSIGFKIVAILIIGFIATSVAVTFYWYFKNSEENRYLRAKYTELQNQINEKKLLIEKLKEMREEELMKYEMERKKLMSLPENRGVDQENATDTKF